MPVTHCCWSAVDQLALQKVVILCIQKCYSFEVVVLRTMLHLYVPVCLHDICDYVSHYSISYVMALHKSTLLQQFFLQNTVSVQNALQLVFQWHTHEAAML